MIAVVAQKTAWSLDKLPGNWFDVTFALLLLFGMWRGRKHGMSREFIPLGQCLIILIAGGFGHVVLGEWLIQQGVIKQVFGSSFNEKTAAFVTSYVAIMVAVFMVFSLIKRFLKSKLEGSSIFGDCEYYFGMIAGVIRYAAVVLIFLALLKAPYYTAAEVIAHKIFMMDIFGLQGAQRGNFKSEGISGDYLPNIQTVQSSVFEGSVVGQFVKESMPMLLINSQPALPKNHMEYHN